MGKKLFAVYLGGRAPKCNTELHDVVFVVGTTIEETYEQLMDKWFGTPDELHLDSWLEVDVVDGYRVLLSPTEPKADEKLFFVNLGAYAEDEFMELHANMFLITTDAQQAKRRAKKTLLQNWPSAVHTDDIHEVDDCLELHTFGSLFIHLEKTGESSKLKPVNGYHIIPKDIIEDYIKRRVQSSS